MTKITERVKSYEDAVLLTELFEQKIKSNEAFVKLCRIIEALNEGHVFDWSDWSERKYFIYSKYLDSVLFGGSAAYGSAAGFGYASALHAPSITYAFIGSRLCFKSADLANYVINTFPELLKDLFIIKR